MTKTVARERLRGMFAEGGTEEVASERGGENGGAFLHWSPYDRVRVVNADP
jgi:hypothetical protein